MYHDDVIKWKHFPRYWPFVRGIYWSPVNSPHKVQWCGVLMFSLIFAWTNGWINNRNVGDLRRCRANNDVTVYVAPAIILRILCGKSSVCWESCGQRPSRGLEVGIVPSPAACLSMHTGIYGPRLVHLQMLDFYIDMMTSLHQNGTAGGEQMPS